MQEAVSIVVFTDLDGTLLDHDTYSWAPAQSALERLARHRIPVVLASSKTAAEMKNLQAQMQLQAYPAIVENGAGVLFSEHAEEHRTDIYAKLRVALDDLPTNLRSAFVGFGDMTSEKVAELTGLSLAAARLARARQFSEPGLWTGDPELRSAFLDAIGKKQIAARDGGRFMTLSFGQTKKDRMNEIQARLKTKTTFALGDAPNDVEMLEHADFGVIVANPHRTALPGLKGEDTGRIVRTKEPGPKGWNHAVHSFLDQLEMHQGEPNFG